MKHDVEYEDTTLSAGSLVNVLDEDSADLILVAYLDDLYFVAESDLASPQPTTHLPPRTHVSAETILLLYPGCDLSRVPSRQTPDGLRYDPIEAMLIAPVRPTPIPDAVVDTE